MRFMIETRYLSIERYLDTAGVAEMLSVAPETVKRWRAEGGGPPFARVSHKCVRYAVSEVMAWMRQKSAASVGDEAAA